MQSCFTNVEILLRMYLCLMVTNCTGERSFSKLRRIKNAQRTTIGQGRLNMLTLMSIKSGAPCDQTRFEKLSTDLLVFYLLL